MCRAQNVQGTTQRDTCLWWFLTSWPCAVLGHSPSLCPHLISPFLSGQSARLSPIPKRTFSPLLALLLTFTVKLVGRGALASSSSCSLSSPFFLGHSRRISDTEPAFSALPLWRSPVAPISLNPWGTIKCPSDLPSESLTVQLPSCSLSPASFRDPRCAG